MRPDDRDLEDDELHRLLAKWTAPVVPDSLDENVLTAFRQQTRADRPGWLRFLRARIQVPLPVAVGLVLLLLATALFALRRPPAAREAEAPAESATSVQSARGAERPVVTRTSLAGFRPVSEVTATVVSEGSEGRP